ncbi:hypothetical protein B5X24_HaOG209979 [Helicoverpa armigera]|uniref:EGF-like domain-containing protein n=1 Tax=Helicoverpa armigera TaxID=29058 RepID=A0A2W1BFS5_HELAM|nr:hypothetical protein B5X24_HaOG209979 [Helicoverpa armigera]
MVTSEWFCHKKARTPPAEVIAKCDSCHSSPCRNGGTCRARARGGHECACARGYHGDACQHHIDACYGSPCAHGVCRVLEEGRFHCSCQPGYTGARCEVNIDDCVANKCQNNATCVDHLEGYSCRCAPGFMGKFHIAKIFVSQHRGLRGEQVSEQRDLCRPPRGVLL